MVYRMASSDTTPAAVRASLIQSTVKWAGLDNPGPVGRNPQADLADIAKSVVSMSDEELELRITQMVVKRAPKPASPILVEGATYDAE
jgi:hypothetical protein